MRFDPSTGAFAPGEARRLVVGGATPRGAELDETRTGFSEVRDPVEVGWTVGEFTEGQRALVGVGENAGEVENVGGVGPSQGAPVGPFKVDEIGPALKRFNRLGRGGHADQQLGTFLAFRHRGFEIPALAVEDEIGRSSRFGLSASSGTGWAGAGASGSNRGLNRFRG